MRIKLEKNNSVCDMGIDDWLWSFFFVIDIIENRVNG